MFSYSIIQVDIDVYYGDDPGKMNDSANEAILRRIIYVCKAGTGTEEGKK
jgi:hypothetical protein